MFHFVGRWKVKGSSAPERDRLCRKCSCSLLNTSKSTGPRTSGSRRHNSGQSNISNPHKHRGRHQSVCIPLCFVGSSCKACKTVTPWEILHRFNKKKMHTRMKKAPGDEILEEITVWKNDLLFKSQIGMEDVQKRNLWRKEMLIIGCQSVMNDGWAFLFQAASKVLAICSVCSPNSLTNFQMHSLISDFAPPNPGGLASAIISDIREMTGEQRRNLPFESAWHP